MERENELGEFLTACVTDHERAQTMLLARPSLIEECVHGDETPLIYLATENCVSGVEFLVRHGANVNTKNRFGDTALSIACMLGYEEMCKTLLMHDADPNLVDVNHETPLHKASSSNHQGIIELLLTAGADVDARDISGETPLHSAARDGALDTLIALLDAGADPTGGGDCFFSPLDFAKQSGAKTIVEELTRRISQM